MRSLLPFFVTIGLFLAPLAFADSTENWTVKSIQCLAGTVDPAKTYQVGSTMSAKLVRNVAKHLGPDSLDEDDTEAHLLLNASGDKDGMCKNAGADTTVQIITFSKK